MSTHSSIPKNAPEMAETTGRSSPDLPANPGKRDAFKELLSPKAKQQRHTSSDASASHRKLEKGAIGGPRDALGAYIAAPESYPSHVVVYYNDDFVTIHDRYPKSTLHLLLLPRDHSKTRVHPFDAFDDPQFLDKVKAEATKLRSFAAGELRRRYGRYSEQDRAREKALSAEPPPDQLPRGRDWERELMCGIHAGPSMNHLHVHVIAVDRYSDRLKHRKHYNSFATPFFIDIEDFPLAPDDRRRHPGREGYLHQNLVCWRCGEDFGNRFTELKAHLEKEFIQWRKL